MPGVGRCFFLPKRLCIHIFDASTLVIVLMFQGTALNFYIISYFKNSGSPYLLFIADFLCVFAFIGTLAASYTYLKTTYSDEDVEDGFSFKPRRLRLPPRSKWGVLPMCYASWIFYTVILVVKIIIIFESDLVDHLHPGAVMGPQMLKVTIACASFIFLLLVEGHQWAKRGTPRYSHVTTVCAKTAIEIFDSASMLSILADKPNIYSLTEPIKDAILSLSVITLFLPTLPLYQLSLSDFGMTQMSLPLVVIYHMLHLTLVDVPFLSFRLYLWLVYKDKASMFIMKNVMSIVLTLRGMYPDLYDLKKGLTTRPGSTSRRSPRPREGFEDISLNETSKLPATV